MHCCCGQETTWRTLRCPRCARRLVAGAPLWRLAIDAAAGLGLLAALGLVFLWDRNGAHVPSNGGTSGKDGLSLSVVESAVDPPPPVRPLRLAVTEPEYDDMGKLLDTLGSGYRYSVISFDDLLNTQRMRQYDCAFVTCGYVPATWVGQRLRSGERDGSEIFQARDDVQQQIKDSLRAFVGRGGTLYVSDWHFQLLAIAFPESIDEAKIATGATGTVRASVLDAGLARRLGPRIDLRFDKPGWRPAAFRGPQVTSYLSGTFATNEGGQLAAPLLVQFPYENGSVIFTSFHNEKQPGTGTAPLSGLRHRHGPDRRANQTDHAPRRVLTG